MRGNADAASFMTMQGFRRDQNNLDITPIAEDLSSACRYVLSNYEKFGVASHYGDLREAFQSLLREIEPSHPG